MTYDQRKGANVNEEKPEIRILQACRANFRAVSNQKLKLQRTFFSVLISATIALEWKEEFYFDVNSNLGHWTFNGCNEWKRNVTSTAHI